MIDFFFINKLLIIGVGGFGLYLAFWVYLANRKAKTNQLFAVMMFFALAWITLCYFSGILSGNLSLSLLLGRLAYGIAILFFIPFYFFSVSFAGEKEKFPFLRIFIPAASLTIFGLSVFTDFMAKAMAPANVLGVPIGVVPSLGKGNFIYFGLVFFVSVLVLFRLIKKYLRSAEQDKTKFQYFLFGISIFVITNLIFNVMFPFWEGNARYYQIGNYSVIFLLAFTAYAIVKRELFGIKVVLTALFVALIAILLALDALVLTPQLVVQIVKAGILVIFLYFGYLLIRSVLEEIKRREDLERLTAQLGAAHIKLSAAYQKLQRLDKAKSEFVSIASHQLRTPLTAIKGYVSMLIEGSYGKLGERPLKPLQNVYKSNERLIKLVNDLLSVSRIEAGRVELEFKEESIEDVISTVVEELGMEARKKGIDLKWQKPKEPLPKVLIDKEKFRQVILNVVDNAIRYTKSGYVAITAKSETRIPKSETQGKIIIEVKDTGEGLSKEEIAKLFESFSRASAGSRLWTEGAGLGLYVAKKFVEMHKGRIWAESEGKGKGATFCIELPMK